MEKRKGIIQGGEESAAEENLLALLRCCAVTLGDRHDCERAEAELTEVLLPDPLLTSSIRDSPGAPNDRRMEETKIGRFTGERNTATMLTTTTDDDIEEDGPTKYTTEKGRTGTHVM
eukprot:CAMPEP_0113328332 /NCGR_PEP_ID=MMETSP0010_2-20120614/19950_1 /TAXON_ID=216773 ORGANISM="Corethron hystrix, Strain 308" /NCGR_SAMPLE_ID=MMETSP0010_2 /ASSEMBLY_ACC=CAM_ASM_000155 /LENGTH=116 /DNA_ID=CAMNT_0000189627 /DNA_START=107 /DNA_END=458 /DNA_ORIENTATION=- /assembly_acc=CAM_ASM_000155